MKTREEILRTLARSEDDRLLLAHALDKLYVCRERCYPTSTRFLDPRERALVEAAVRLAGAQQESVFFGGYEEAERVCALFFPDYLTAEEAITGENCPIALLRAVKAPADTLSHRDYLGAIMGLQLERATVGDILVHEDGADLLVLREMADFLRMNLLRAGKRRIVVDEVPLSSLRTAVGSEKTGSGSVASLRLDGVCALIFGLSRAEAQNRIEKGLVYLNSRACTKPDQEIGEGDRLTVRGLGRAKVTSLGGKSRKGRQFLTYTRTI